MATRRRLPRLKKGEFLTAEAWNALCDFVESIQVLPPSAPLGAKFTPAGVALSLVAAPSGVVRMKVTDPAPGGGTGVVKAKRWDGTNGGGADVYVLGVQGHALNDDFAAVRVRGGVPGSPTGPAGKPVPWVEVLILPVGTTRYQFVQVIDTHGKLGIDSARFEA